MPLRVSNTVEKNVTSVPQAPIVVAANNSKQVLPDVTADTNEYAGRYIQNVGAGIAYYAFGETPCSASYFNGMLSAAGSTDSNGLGSGQQLDASNCGQAITVFSVAGTTIAVTLLKRNDLSQINTGILNHSA